MTPKFQIRLIVQTLVFFCLALGFLPPSEARICISPTGWQDKNLAKEFPLARDQDSIGWCYAYAGADLYGHWLKKTGQIQEGQQISAAGMALTYNNESRLNRYTENRRMAEKRDFFTERNQELDKEINQMAIQRAQRFKTIINSNPQLEQLNTRVAALANNVERMVTKINNAPMDSDENIASKKQLAQLESQWREAATEVKGPEARPAVCGI